MQLPDGDQVSMSRKQMLAKLDICMGGRVAEELIFGEDNVTSGASSDFQQATRCVPLLPLPWLCTTGLAYVNQPTEMLCMYLIYAFVLCAHVRRLARAMVTKWGFSSKLGVQSIDDKDTSYSSETQSIIDSEVRQLLNDSYHRAKTLLEKNRSQLTRIAEALIEHETLSGAEVAAVANGKAINLRNRSQKASRESKVLPLPKKSPPPGKGGQADISKRPATVSSVVTNPAAKTTDRAKTPQNADAVGSAAPQTLPSSAKKPSGAVRGPPTSSSTAEEGGK